MANKKQGGGEEPSMEEILSSIRQIISDESTGESEESDDFSDLNEDIVSAEEEDEDVLDLTEPAGDEDEAEDAIPAADGEGAEEDFFLEPAEDDDDGPRSSLFAADDDEADEAEVPDDVAAASDDVADAGVVYDPERDAPREEPPAMSDSEDDGTWISPPRAEQATASLTQLAAASRKDEFGQGPKSDSDRILENMVREALRPQVKAWLDANLPGLVERIVREEVRRMTRRAEAEADPGDDPEQY